MDRRDFELLCHHVEEPGAMCIKCAWVVVDWMQEALRAIEKVRFEHGPKDHDCFCVNDWAHVGFEVRKALFSTATSSQAES